MKIFSWFRREPVTPPPPPEPKPKHGITAQALQDMVPDEMDVLQTGRAIVAPTVMPGVIPQETKLAMDRQLSPVYDFASNAYGMAGFIGWPELMQLATVSENQRMNSVLAEEMTREWGKVVSTGDDKQEDRIAKIEAEMQRLNIQEVFHSAALDDGNYGRAQIYANITLPQSKIEAFTDPAELATALPLDPAKVTKGSVLGFRTVQPIWSYPGTFDTLNPMSPEFYVPQMWWVMGKNVHHSRLKTIVSRPVPDVLKPAYSFSGISLIQLCYDYVDNWKRTRGSVSDIVNGFSIPVLKTNLGDLMQGGLGAAAKNRVKLWQKVRSNFSLMLLHKDPNDKEGGEEFSFEHAQLTGLDKLQAQAQEQQCSISGIPLVKLLGSTPSGLNASSDGEIRVFYDSIAARQARDWGLPIKWVIDLIQLSLFGDIDESIDFKFNPLWQENEAEKATTEKTRAETDDIRINSGVIAPQEARDALKQSQDNPYSSLSDEIDPTEQRYDGTVSEEDGRLTDGTPGQPGVLDQRPVSSTPA